MAATWRATQKEARRAELLRTAASLFAERGFASVSTGELGEAVGITGPALYKHFPSKDAVLVELLESASEDLLAGCRRIVGEQGDAREQNERGGHGSTLRRLIEFHLSFAMADPDVIRIQDRELPNLPAEANHRVRRLQREYVQEWDRVLAEHIGADAAERQLRLLAVFGLLNSTPFSAADPVPAAPRILADMAEAALLREERAEGV